MNIRIVRVDLAVTNSLLVRIAAALERLAGPVLTHPVPAKSTLSDLYSISPEDVTRQRQAREEFAAGAKVVPDSEAFWKAVAGYEEEVLRDHGADAVAELPWRKMKRGQEAAKP